MKAHHLNFLLSYLQIYLNLHFFSSFSPVTKQNVSLLQVTSPLDLRLTAQSFSENKAGPCSASLFLGYIRGLYVFYYPSTLLQPE